MLFLIVRAINIHNGTIALGSRFFRMDISTSDGGRTAGSMVRVDIPGTQIENILASSLTESGRDTGPTMPQTVLSILANMSSVSKTV